jgi:hypothetical protein
MKTKDISNTGNETVKYKVLPLGNNVYSMDSFFFLICYPSHPFDPLLFLPAQIRPNYSTSGVDLRVLLPQC